MHQNGLTFKKIIFILLATFSFDFYQAKAADQALLRLAKALIDDQNEYVDSIIEYNKIGSNGEEYDFAQLKERYLQIIQSDEMQDKTARNLGYYLTAEEAQQLTPVWRKLREFFKTDFISTLIEEAITTARQGCLLNKATTSTNQDGVVEALSSENFTNAISKGKSIVKVSTTWCGPCLRLKPIYSQLSGTYAGQCSFYEIDADENQDLSHSLKIEGFPTMIFFQDGVEQKRLAGFRSMKELATAIDEFLAAPKR